MIFQLFELFYSFYATNVHGRMEYIDHKLSRIKDQVCILSQHTFTLFRKTVFQVFWYILFSIASSITVSHEWFFQITKQKL